jgi:nucleoside-diphosphate-sugar epimerase
MTFVTITGGTGYLGSKLIPALLSRGHSVRTLVRPGSEKRVPTGAEIVVGDALNADSIRAALREGDTVVHLIGTPHPGPGKAKEFERVDLASIRAAVTAAKSANVAHFVYLSVAQPAPMMRDYVAVRAEGERLIAEADLTATMVRPWYVLGPGHRWPTVLIPMYAVAELIPSLRDGAQRMGLVTLSQMTKALVFAVENPPERGTRRVMDVSGIRRATIAGVLAS